MPMWSDYIRLKCRRVDYPKERLGTHLFDFFLGLFVIIFIEEVLLLASFEPRKIRRQNCMEG